MRSRIALFVLAAMAVAPAARPVAHEIVPSVTVHAFIKPEAHRLRVLLRVPVHAMRDIDFPTRGPGYLDIPRADQAMRNAAQMWIVNALEVHEDAIRLDGAVLVAAKASLPSDRSFASYDSALAHVTGPRLPDDTAIVWDQALLDVLIEYPIRSERAAFSFRSDLARLGMVVTTGLRFVSADGTVRAFEYTGDPGLVRLDPRWHQAALHFVRLGFVHILQGPDHLLFLLCLIVPIRRLRPLVLVITAFTVAHSIALLAAANGATPDGLWFPPLVETLIAASIVYMAFENIVAAARAGGGPIDGGRGKTVSTGRWLMAFAFGLVHGFGFSFGLRETLQFAGSHLATSLVSFNIGVELGQIAALMLLVPALHVLFRFIVAERVGAILLSALIAHTGWHWSADRFDRLRQFAWPPLDPALAASAMRWMMGLVIVAGLIWLARRWKSPATVGSRSFPFLLLPFSFSLGPVSQESTMGGIYSAPQAARGEETYMALCVGCHATATHTGDTFKSTWGGRPVSDLFAAIKEKMPKNEPGSLTPEETAQIIAYVLKLNDVPAGKTDLPTDTEALKKIRIEMPLMRQ